MSDPVLDSIARKVAAGERRIIGVMAESNLVEGRQDLAPGLPPSSLAYGQSVTDACLGWEDTTRLLATLAEAVQARRRQAAS